MIMTTGAQESGKDDAVWAMLQEATNPDYIKMVVDVNGAVPARSSVMDAIPDYCEEVPCICTDSSWRVVFPSCVRTPLHI